ncbi:MAG: hypothetical protein M1826_007511 [Phylliscum demangeonii]|nr:MAG: hypothetical protein M1826_007511 [Phylliscum demangeonii]
MKSSQFLSAATSLSAVLGVALARPVPDLAPLHSLVGFLTDGTVLTSAVAAGLGAITHWAFTDLKATVAQVDKDRALDRLKSAQQEVSRVSEAATAKVEQLQAQVPTAKENYAQLSRCWFAELQIAIRKSSAATWPDSIGDDMWAKCIKFHPNIDVRHVARPALDFKRYGASRQKKLGLFQDSAAASIIDRPLPFVLSPAVQQMHHLHHNLQKVSAAGVREVRLLSNVGAGERGDLETAAVRFRAAGL